MRLTSKRQWIHVGTALSRLGNTLIGLFTESPHWGERDQTISGVSGAYKERGEKLWFAKFVDWLLHPWDRNHCVETAEWERRSGYRD